MIKRILVLDVDDTIYPESAYAQSALRVIELRAKEILGISGIGKTAARLFAEGKRGDLFQLAIDEIGAPPATESQISRLVQAYREHRPISLPWFPDALNFVENHKSGGGQVAIISDGYLPTQRNKVEALGLSNVAAPIVLSEELGREFWKPSPRPYEIVMESFDRDSRFVYIGDNPLKDFISAKQLGWMTVRVRRRGGEHFYKEAPSADYASHFEVADFSGVFDLWGSFN